MSIWGQRAKRASQVGGLALAVGCLAGVVSGFLPFAEGEGGTDLVLDVWTGKACLVAYLLSAASWLLQHAATGRVARASLGLTALGNALVAAVLAGLMLREVWDVSSDPFARALIGETRVGAGAVLNTVAGILATAGAALALWGSVTQARRAHPLGRASC